MKNIYDRRTFIKAAAIGSAGLTFSGTLNSLYAQGQGTLSGKRVGIIGLDTSHAIAFAKTLNAVDVSAEYRGYKVVAAYPKGSNDIKMATDRIPVYTEQIKSLGVEIVDSLSSLLKKVDVVLLETNDGRIHLEQALPVLKAGKRMFIDKPIAASLSDAKAIFEASTQYNTPVFSTSSLRYMDGISDIVGGKIGKVIGVEAYSPSPLEKTHPDFAWYGIHGIEILFSLMGTGCKSVSRIHKEDTDVVVGTWADNRIGTFRGIRTGKRGYGATVFGEKAIMNLGEFRGYSPLLLEIVKFFDTGIVPVKMEETLEICSFIEAADISKTKAGASVSLNDINLKFKD